MCLTKKISDDKVICLLIKDVSAYAGIDMEGNKLIVKAGRPASLFRNNVATPSIVSAIFNGMYVNALLLYRIEQELCIASR